MVAWTKAKLSSAADEETWAFDTVHLVQQERHTSTRKEATVSISADLLGFVVELRNLHRQGNKWTERSFALSLSDAINEMGRITHEHLHEGYKVAKGERG